MLESSGQTYPIQVGSLKVGSHVVINKRPCKIVEFTTSKTGKHGGAKAHMNGIDIFTGDKYEHRIGTTKMIDVPIIIREELPVMSIDEEGYVSLLDNKGDLLSHLKVSGDLQETIESALQRGRDITAVVVSALGEQYIITSRE